ncbi:MAG TPA: hypothetical protein PLS56_01340 [Candidatus Dojkabacteria bacterium]|nr:hypothetical protein [Candidatus Dojkabacteria bacterium]
MKFSLFYNGSVIAMDMDIQEFTQRLEKTNDNWHKYEVEMSHNDEKRYFMPLIQWMKTQFLPLKLNS